MIDQRVKKLADILVNYSIRIKKGDVISVFGGVESKSLLLEICKLILKKGALPRLNVGLDGSGYIYFKYASEEQLKYFPKISMYEAKNVAGEITVNTENNTRELSNIDPKKLSIRRKTIKPIRDIHLKKHNWVCCEYPTNALAQEADMSLQEF